MGGDEEEDDGDEEEDDGDVEYMADDEEEDDGDEEEDDGDVEYTADDASQEDDVSKEDDGDVDYIVDYGGEDDGEEDSSGASFQYADSSSSVAALLLMGLNFDVQIGYMNSLNQADVLNNAVATLYSPAIIVPCGLGTDEFMFW